jgi:hypothetical protein
MSNSLWKRAHNVISSKLIVISSKTTCSVRPLYVPLTDSELVFEGFRMQSGYTRVANRPEAGAVVATWVRTWCKR